MTSPANTVPVVYPGQGRHTEPVALVDFNAFETDGQAYPTSRYLSGSDDFWAAVEYAENGYVMIDGERRPACRIFLFDDKAITDDDAGEPRQEEDYPWDIKHCPRIELAD